MRSRLARDVANAMTDMLNGCVTMDDYRKAVRRLMPDESIQVIDNVASAAWIIRYIEPMGT